MPACPQRFSAGSGFGRHPRFSISAASRKNQQLAAQINTPDASVGVLNPPHK